jgi:SAM-dependent methyltransferase
MTLLNKAWARYQRDGLNEVVRVAWGRASDAVQTRVDQYDPARRRAITEVARDGSVEARLRSSGFDVVPVEVSAAEFQGWFTRTAYPADYCPGPWRKALPEKALEHYLSLQLLALTPADTCVDVASQDSPFADLLRAQVGCRVYRQDLEYPAGLHGDRIGGDAARLPLPADSVTAMTLHCSFEHFEGRSDVEFLREASRVLKPGGKVCILPLYLRDEYLNVLDPLAPDGLHPDDGAKIYSVRRWPGGRFARFYSPEVFGQRVTQAVPLQLRLYRLTNPQAAGPDCYLRYAAVFEKARPSS